MTKRKKPKLTGKEEAFCKAMALAPSNKMTQRDCYIEAYDTTNLTDESIDVLASRLAKLVKIRLRIEDLTEEYSDFLNYNAKAHFQELEEEHKKANEVGKGKRRNPYISLRAVELKGRMTGRYTEKHEHTGKDGESLIPTRIEILGMPVKKEDK